MGYHLMAPVLRLYEDTLGNRARPEHPLLALPRMLYVVHGSIVVGDRICIDGGVWHGEEELSFQAGDAGATVWRWELAPRARAIGAIFGAGIRSHEKLSAPLATLPTGELLMRGDSVAFPPGGCAYTHVHQGPGIRCLIEGGIRIDAHGLSTSYGPGGAWYESGPDPVFAQAAADRPSKFIRVMILPQALKGQSSIRYVNEA